MERSILMIEGGGYDGGVLERTAKARYTALVQREVVSTTRYPLANIPGSWTAV
jgi:hypothetical protein